MGMSVPNGSGNFNRISWHAFSGPIGGRCGAAGRSPQINVFEFSGHTGDNVPFSLDMYGKFPYI